MSPGGGGHPFTLDRFQLEAIAAIDAGENVLVAAPTGAGKTVVADHAVDVAVAAGRRAFYTTPIKALSNQKYADLVARLGRSQVGLLTGDNAINGDAPVVVMTTEVLRNMIYARSGALERVDWVVLDEVHYLQDAYRGPVWEEVIVHAPEPMRFVCLSATVSNADELAGWIEATRGRIRTVVEHERPVELVNHYLVYDKGSGELVQALTLLDGRPNPEGTRFDAPAGGDGPRSTRGGRRPKHRWGTPRRTEVVEHLAVAGLLPAIFFIFSRKGCDEAVRAVLDAGARLTRGPERREIRAIVERHVSHLAPDDLAVLGYDRWLAGLEAGVAAHHAGMVPPFKEAVEACFVEGLVKVVFATETLALGINMPARSVVIESLSKFTGEHHEDLTPGQYTQLTGRAGRRGLDPVGHALVLWSPWQGFDTVAALASSREFVLRSAFRPTYNMVTNLVRRYDRDEAHELLGRSFAQYQADASLGRLIARRAKVQRRLEAAEAEATCERGSVDEYRELRAKQRREAREARHDARGAIEAALEDLSPGDVVRLSGQRLAVLSVSHRKGSVRVRVVDPDARTTLLEPDDVDEVVERAGAVSLPEPYDPASRVYQRRIASSLRKARLRPPKPSGGGPARRRDVAGAVDHPVAACADLDAHLRAAADRDRLRAQLDDIDRRSDDRRGSLSRQLDQIERVLARRGFIDGWRLTERGALLARIFHESDLLVASALDEGLLDGLDTPSMAAMVSLFTYEHRAKEAPPPPWYPSGALRSRADAVVALAADIQRAEARAGLSSTRLADPSFFALAYAWASGEPFDVVIEGEDLSGGDFVRNVKQLIDLLRQLGEVAPLAETAASARAAADALHRGVVAASSEVPGPEAAVDGSSPA